MNKGSVRRLFCVICALAGAALCVLYLYAWVRRPWEPPQPMPFSHDTHTQADKAAMPCQACHAGAEKGAKAGLPAAETCLDCHRHILAQDARLQPLHAAADADSAVYTGEPLRWQRAYPLPSYVHFHHAAHTAKYDCERCHPTPGKESPMLMRDCLECHRRDSTLSADCTTCHH